MSAEGQGQYPADRFAVILMPEGVDVRRDINGLHPTIKSAFQRAKILAGWEEAKEERHGAS